MDTFIKGKRIILRDLFKKSIHFLYKNIEPKSENEDLKRREFILNVLLLGSVTLAFFATIFAVVDYINFGSSFKGDTPLISLGVFTFFLALFVLSRRGFYVVVSYIFVAIYFVAATHTGYSWGVDIPQGLLIYVLVIIMSGILVSTRFAVVVTMIVSITVLLLGYFQNSSIVHPNLYWRDEMFKIEDTVIFVVTFGVIVLVSWLSNREIEKSLLRARAAERDLRKERDSLEIKVKQRTSELERLQFEKTEQMQRFVEFGRASSGLFHDMVNPVQAAILSIEHLKNVAPTSSSVDIKKYINEAVVQMEKARSFINTARSQITKQEISINFDPEEQIAIVFQMLSFRAKREKVQLIRSKHLTGSALSGNPLSFNRLVAGLVSNAIDSYDGVVLEKDNLRTVTVTSEKNENSLKFSVADNGKGINKENQERIFELFFTTKGVEKGTGIGLAICKEITEKEFGGTLSFKSDEGVGAVFVVEIPIKK